LNNSTQIISLATNTLKTEADSVMGLIDKLDEGFVNSVQLILNSKGRVVITGIGKSANIANKIVATLNSTGTPAIFMHAADAIHGDLGNIQKNDVVICISNSGNTPEIKVLIPFIKSLGNSIIAFAGNSNSFLAKNADYFINTSVEKEACPHNLAPTSSTTAQLAMGDAIAVCLLELRGFNESDFAKFHPGGALGKKLYLKVEDLYPLNEKPQVGADTLIKDLILEISSKRLGITGVIENDKLIGIVTDGDLRRMLEKNVDFRKYSAKDIMTTNPITIEAHELAATALQLMEKRKITQLIVVNQNKYVGVIHLHDLVREGII